jgi:hypothetical protein
VLAALVAAPALAVELDVTASARSDARARSFLPGDRGDGATMDAEVVPRLSAVLSGTTARFEVWYSPSLVFRDLPGNNQLVPLHRGRAALGFGIGQARVSLTQDIDWGVSDIGPLTTIEAAPGTMAPVVNPHLATLVPYERSASRAAFDGKLATLVTLRLEADYLIAGSRDGTKALPLQRGPGGLAAVGVLLNANDTLLSTLVARSASFSTGQDQQLGWLSETWSRKVSAMTAFEVAGGAGYFRTAVPGLTRLQVYSAVVPVASAGLTTRWPVANNPLEGRFRVAVGPYADQFTGTVYERLEGQAGVSWTWRHELVLTALGGVGTGAAVTGLPQASDWVVTGQASANWTVTRWLLLGAQASAAKTSFVNTGFPSTLWLAGVNLTVVDQEHNAW